MIQSSVPQSIQRSTQLGMANRNVDRLYSVLIRFALDLAWCGVLWRAVNTPSSRRTSRHIQDPRVICPSAFNHAVSWVA